jgi:protein-tyrosine phosphatase
VDKVFWLIPGRLAGRSGPDRHPWDLASLRRAGIGAILSVNDGLLCHADDFAAHGIAYACVPLSDDAPPLPGDDEYCLTELPLAHAFVQREIAKGHAVVVHCSSGKDRTGLYLCYYLVRDGASPDEAIDQVRRVRPIALSAQGWEALARRVLSQAR